VGDREPGLLARLDEMRLGLETEFRVLDVEPIDGLITILVAGRKRVLGRGIASQIIVQKIEGGE